jgi:hypothetical protein
MFAWNEVILTTSCSVTERFRKINIPSHDRVCDDRIRHLNHMRSLIVLSTKLNISPFRKFESSAVDCWLDSNIGIYYFSTKHTPLEVKAND